MAKIKLVDRPHEGVISIPTGEKFIYSARQHPEMETDPIHALYRLCRSTGQESTDMFYMSRQQQSARVKAVADAYDQISQGERMLIQREKDDTDDIFRAHWTSSTQFIKYIRLPEYHTMDSIQELNMIDLEDISANRAYDIISNEYKKGEEYTGYRSFSKYNADRSSCLAMMPYCMYLYPYMKKSTPNRKFNMLPCYDEGVYKITRYRYLYWRILEQKDSIFIIQLADYAWVINTWMMVRTGKIIIKADEPYHFSPPLGERFNYVDEITTDQILAALFGRIVERKYHGNKDTYFKDTENGRAAFETVDLMTFYTAYMKHRGVEYARTCYVNKRRNPEELKDYANTGIFNIEEFVEQRNKTLGQVTDKKGFGSALDAASYISDLRKDAHKALSVSANYELYTAFLNINNMINDVIDETKPKQRRRKPETDKPKDTEKVFFYDDATTGRQMISIGGAKFRVDEAYTSQIITPIKITYTVPSWNRRAHKRTLKNGKVISVRSSVCHRKGFVDVNAKPAASTVTIKSSDDVSEAKKLCKEHKLNFETVAVYAEVNKINVKDAVNKFIS